MEKINERAILCERECNGEFERMALSYEEFDGTMEYDNLGVRSKDITDDWSSIDYNGAATLYCRTAVVGDDAWIKFFTDMQFGLPKQAVAEGKYSAVRVDAMGRMRGYLKKEASRLLFAWCIAKDQGIEYKECFTEDGIPTEKLDTFSQIFRDFVDHKLGFDK